MTNMFSDKKEKDIPKTIDECLKPNRTITNLHTWAERLLIFGEKLLTILCVVGVVSTVIEAVKVAQIDDEQIVFSIITSLVTWGIYIFVEYCAYHVLALLITALADITHNTLITANIALLEASNNKNLYGNIPANTSDIPKNVVPKDRIAINQKKCWACDTVQNAKNRICINCGESL